MIRSPLTGAPGPETYRVRAGAVTAVVVGPGDRLDVIDPAGRQAAELTALPEPGAGRSGEVLGTPTDSPATVLRRLAAERVDEPGADEVRALLAAVGLDPRTATAALLFGEWSPAGSREQFTAHAPGIVLVAAPARPMFLDDPAANPPSGLVLEVHRTGPPPVVPELPPPLAEPVLDLRIDASTALAYEVAAGQYVQIIDVAGRQCSDLLAFDARALQDGVENLLDATTTRSIVGRAHPMPGLTGRYFDQTATSLLEVVQDTVGRHDTFNLACTAKYYADAGYPGHVNCTDNFNAELARFGVAARRGWAALNLFYNTAFDADHQIVIDEPWSRPGDHVLLRASTDLVCASSACPDDIDPANGWVPTDIHLRVYDTRRTFAVSMAHRVTPDAEAVPTRRTGFASRTEALTRRFTEYRGYWTPTAYDNHGPQAEYWSCRERAAVMDLSMLRKFEVLGPDAEALLQATLTRDVRRLAPGQVVYSALCTDTGGMVDDCTLFRLGADNFRFVGGDEYDGVWLREQAARLGLEQVWIKGSTDQLHNLAVQGPASRDVLDGLIWTPPTQPAFADLTWFRFAIGRLHGPDGVPLLVSRTGYTGELGYELFVHPSQAEQLWDAIWAAGRPHGLTPLGLDALDMLRIEAGLVFAGHDFDDTTDPFEAGIGFTVPLKSKTDDFVGRDALLSRKAHPQRRLVGLEIDGGEMAAHGDDVYVGRFRVGVVTSATRSPLLGRNLALCRLAVQHAVPGTAVEVGKLDGHRKRLAATVVPLPFYDPEKRRPRS